MSVCFSCVPFQIEAPDKGNCGSCKPGRGNLGESSVKRTFSTGVERETVNVRRNEAPTKKVSANHHLKPPFQGYLKSKYLHITTPNSVLRDIHSWCFFGKCMLGAATILVVTNIMDGRCKLFFKVANPPGSPVRICCAMLLLIKIWRNA